MNEETELHIHPKAGLQDATCTDCGHPMTLRVVERTRPPRIYLDYRGSCENCGTIYVGTVRPEVETAANS